MQFFRRVKRLISTGRTPMRVGHVYRDTVTGENVEITSVRQVVEVESVDRSNKHKTSKDIVRKAITDGLLVHDVARCSECYENKDV